MGEHVGVAAYLFVERVADGFLLGSRGSAANTRHEPELSLQGLIAGLEVERLG